MFTNDLNVAGANLSDSLNELVNKNVQKMQQREMLKQMLIGQPQGQPGMGNYTLSQSLNAGDFLRGQNPQNLIERSAGRTPIKLPSIMQDVSQQQVQQAQPQLPALQQQTQMTPPQNESPVDKKERLLREREEIKAARAREKEERAEKSKKQMQIDKETLPFYKKMKEAAASIPEVDARLDEMEELLDTGNVQWFGLLDSLSKAPYIGPFAGAIEQAFLTTESQVFKKLSTDFLRDAKPYFGSNMSTREVELFLQRVPSLMLSNEGNRALIRNLRSLTEYSKEVDKILEGIIAENGGERPRHLESKLQERLGPATEKLRKSFKQSVKLIPKKQVDEDLQALSPNKKKKVKDMGAHALRIS
jgi:hypothetical protein